MNRHEPTEILSAAEMAKADRLTIMGGMPGPTLMQNAGSAAVQEIVQAFSHRRALVLCGPGKNGGDGFVIARLLRERGWDVRVACLVPVKSLRGDAAWAASEWKGDVLPFEGLEVAPDELVVDSVFGTGFKGALDAPVSDVFLKVREAAAAVAAVDIPSGVSADTGEADPYALRADLTVTFFRKKIGHVLMPGLAWCGRIVMRNIGMPYAVIVQVKVAAQENVPEHWAGYLRPKSLFDNKYSHGHAVIFGGERMTGAACLAGHAAMRIRAGLCTIAGHRSAADVYRGYLPTLLFEPWDRAADFKASVQDARRNAILIGPGAGLEDPEGLRAAVAAACGFGPEKACVLDADALNAFEGRTEELCAALHDRCVMTPHEGEFRRLFPDIKGSKIERAAEAARHCGAAVVLKGPDTVIAAPDGRIAVNINGPSSLATAGTGDVLAGMITGLCAQGIAPYEASCAAAWIHGEAAYIQGPGLIASDLPDLIPRVLREIK